MALQILVPELKSPEPIKKRLLKVHNKAIFLQPNSQKICDE